jgi:thioredoxin 1
MGVPTFLYYKGGKVVDRVTGGEATAEKIREKTEKLL